MLITIILGAVLGFIIGGFLYNIQANNFNSKNKDTIQNIWKSAKLQADLDKFKRDIGGNHD